jgi:magnesium chelatase subunit H
MQKLITVVNKTPLKFVLITMDTHLVSASEKANFALQREMPNLDFKIHAAAGWATAPEKLAECKQDIAQADIVVTTMLFLEDHFLPILDDLKARRDHCDAMVCAMSAAEVVPLTKIGDFDMSKPTSGPLALLKKMRGSKEKNKTGGAAQMKMLRRLPKILKYIPGTAQDVRNYFLTLQYWLGGSEENMYQMVRFLIHKYADGPRASLKNTKSKIVEPVMYPDSGVYHPRLKGRISEDLSQVPKLVPDGKARGKIGILLLRSYVLAGNTQHYDAVFAALEARGFQIVPVFAAGLDARPAIDQFLVKNDKCTVDAMISLTGFSLVGGPAYNDAKAAQEVLSRLDVPYIAAHPVEFQNLSDWGASERGLLPVESTLMVAIPELDGATNPIVYGGRSGAPGTTCTGCHRHCTFTETNNVNDMFTCVERVDMLAARVDKLITLKKSTPHDRKVAVVIFNFPPNAGRVGTAAYLGVFESIYETMARMKHDGYQVDMPSSVEELRESLLHGNAQHYNTDANVHFKIPANDHVKRETWLKDIEKQWGPAPGKQLSDGSGIFILGKQFGNILVAVQPGFGYEGDPMRLLHEKGFAPTHAFSAFYRYLREDFGAHAALHFGTHGALEFMPGKQTGLSGNCWPDRLIKDLPNIYLYASNNPSEGAIAKRRSGATLISYLTPPIAQAGLYKGLADLKASVDRYRLLPEDDNDATNVLEREQLSELILSQATSIEVIPVATSWSNLNQKQISAEVVKLSEDLLEYEYALIPEGMHVIGKKKELKASLDMLKSMAKFSVEVTLDDAVFLDIVKGSLPQEITLAHKLGKIENIEKVINDLQTAYKLMQMDSELDGVMNALDGRYIPPAPGGDVLHNLEVLPTGRNLHGFDPFRIPSQYAVKDGAQQAQRILDRHMADTHELPESIALVLWGTDNLKTEGAPIGQVLALMGAQPRFDSYGRLVGATLIPLEKLGRPRIDVVVSISGIFRDLMPLQIKLLAEAALIAANADEPIDQNFVRKHALDYMAKMGCDMETAALRVFGNADGTYGANVNLLIDNSKWDDAEELSNTYKKRKGFAYGVSGQPQLQKAELLNSIFADVSLTYQNLDSVELGVTTIDTYFDTLGGITQAVKQAKGGVGSPVYIGDQTSGKGIVRTLNEQVNLETRTRMLNPKWYEGMLQHGFEGVRQIETHLTNTFGWSATTGQVQPWVYQQITETFVLDDVMRERLAELNPSATAKVANRLLEASERKYWNPSPEDLAKLRQFAEELEDRLEGVYQGVAIS